MITTSYLIDKFKGIYRLKVPYDFKTKDYNRKLNGTLEDIDVYIDCSYGIKIYHYGRDILQAYIPSIGTGKILSRQFMLIISILATVQKR